VSVQLNVIYCKLTHIKRKIEIKKGTKRGEDLPPTTIRSNYPAVDERDLGTCLDEDQRNEPFAI